MLKHLFFGGAVVLVTALAPSAHAQEAAPAAAQQGAQPAPAQSAPAQPAPQPAAAQPAAAAPPPTPVPFAQALTKAATDLLSKVPPPAGGGKLSLVIDPLIDGVSGAQSTASREVEKGVLALIAEKYPFFELKPFTPETLAQSPVLLIGTFTAVNNAGQAGGPRDAYRICLRMADLATRKIIAGGAARAIPQGIDATPTASFADSPAWAQETAVQAYVTSCQKTKVGDALDAAYADQLQAGALIAEGDKAYEGGRYEEALGFYQAAQKASGGDQLRVLQGIYNADVKLGRAAAAAEAFGGIVDRGLSNKKVSVKFLFKVGSTDLFGERPYAMWADEIAKRAGSGKACLEVVGHSSHTGPEAFNDTLSAERAVRIRELMRKSAGKAAPELKTLGMGWRENLVGIGTDDARDALDRRVEFRVAASCS